MWRHLNGHNNNNNLMLHTLDSSDFSGVALHNPHAFNFDDIDQNPTIIFSEEQFPAQILQNNGGIMEIGKETEISKTKKPKLEPKDEMEKMDFSFRLGSNLVRSRVREEEISYYLEPWVKCEVLTEAEEEVMRRRNNGGSRKQLSTVTHSVLARRRRHRISERIGNLQRLLPCESKMDTASMLEEAYNYVRFLQAQATVLDAMPKWSYNNGDRQMVLEAVVNSPGVQTLLCSQRLCVCSVEQFNLMLEERGAALCWIS